jgi:hypothetical protein
MLRAGGCGDWTRRGEPKTVHFRDSIPTLPRSPFGVRYARFDGGGPVRPLGQSVPVYEGNRVNVNAIPG